MKKTAPTCQLLATLLVLLLVTIACNSLFVSKIKDVTDNPRHYHGKTVAIRGEVTASLNLLLIKSYTVRDETGEIVVVTDHPVPRVGEKITVKGRVDQAFSIGGKSLVVIIEESTP